MGMSISQIITNLTNAVTQAEVAQEAGKDARNIRNALVKAADVLKPYTVTEGSSVNGQVLRFYMESAIADLNAEADGFDRTEGDALARKAQGVLEADLITDEDFGNAAQATEWVSALVSRWKTLTGTTTGKGRRSGESQVKDLGFVVKVKDEATGQTVASTTKDNLNSLRDQLRKHHEKAHGSKPSKGQPVWEGITEALEAVMHNGTQSAQGGGYLFDRAA